MGEMERTRQQTEDEERRERLAFLPETAWYYLRTYGHMAVDALVKKLEDRGPLPSIFGSVQVMRIKGRITEFITKDGEHHLQAVGPISDNDGPALPDLAIVSEDQSSAPRSS